MRRKWQEWEDRIIDELRECGNGTVTTIAKLMEEAECAAPGEAAPEEAALTDDELNRLERELEADASTCGIILDRYVSPNQERTPVYEREFAVYNSTAGVKCPRCGGTNTPRILPKTPISAAASRKCADCGKEFGALPLIMSKYSRLQVDFRDEVVSIEFVMRKIFGECTRILIRKNADGALVEVSEESANDTAGNLEGVAAAESGTADTESDAAGTSETASAESDGMTGSRQITEEEWDRILHTLYMRFYLNDWSKGYDNRFLPDGPRWELKLKLSGRRQRNYHGSRDMTPYFKDLMKLMLGLF